MLAPTCHKHTQPGFVSRRRLICHTAQRVYGAGNHIISTRSCTPTHSQRPHCARHAQEPKRDGMSFSDALVPEQLISGDISPACQGGVGPAMPPVPLEPPACSWSREGGLNRRHNYFVACGMACSTHLHVHLHVPFVTEEERRKSPARVPCRERATAVAYAAAKTETRRACTGSVRHEMLEVVAKLPTV